MPKEEGIPLARFLHMVGQLKFRGTSVLFRLPRSPVVKKTKTRSPVRELSPVPAASGGEAPESREQNEVVGKVMSKSPQQGRKRVGFVGLGPISEGGRDMEEDMDVGEKDEVDGEVVVPDETLPLHIPQVRVKDEEGRDEWSTGVFSSLENDEFTIATHFVKVRLSVHAHKHTHTHTLNCIEYLHLYMLCRCEGVVHWPM